MKNKILIKLYVMELELELDVFVPVNEIVWKMKKMIVKAISDITNLTIETSDYYLINKNTSRVYKNNELIINTDIRNVSELLLVFK
ncbi:MAG: hypothetical protein IKE75_05760 [Bacilli bacterium]|nr:hypothetical protein [Bacilli bacterium]